MANGWNPDGGGAQHWEQSEGTWTIDPNIFVSAPSSFKHAPIVNQSHTLTCLYPPTQHLAEGRMSYYFRVENSNWQAISPRILIAQAPGVLGTGNCYTLTPRPTPAPGIYRIREWQNYVNTRSWDQPATIYTTQTWHRHRVTWYLDFGQLCINVDRWDGGAWIQHATPLAIPNPLHTTADWQRCGVDFWTQANYITYLDDLIIESYE